MDTSFWIQCNPKIAIEHTIKKYYGRFLHRLVISCPAGRLITESNDMLTALDTRKMMAKSVNHGGWWGYRNSKNLDNADPLFLENMRSLYTNEELDIMLRIEEPMIQIYALDEDTIKQIVVRYFAPGQFKYIKSVCSPEDERATEILNSGGIIRKSDIGFRYKVVLRDARMESHTKESLMRYLTNLDEETVRIPKNTIDMLSKQRSGYVWGMYFYTNDASVLPFINLISPGIVSNCHELHVLNDK